MELAELPPSLSALSAHYSGTLVWVFDHHARPIPAHTSPSQNGGENGENGASMASMEGARNAHPFPRIPRFSRSLCCQFRRGLSVELAELPTPFRAYRAFRAPSAVGFVRASAWSWLSYPHPFPRIPRFSRSPFCQFRQGPSPGR